MTRQIRFGDWFFDPDSHQLECGNYRTTLEPRVARLLEFFVARQGQLITPDELVDAVWDGRVVSDEAVRKGVSALRRALAGGDAGDFIKTVHKRGYISQFPDPRNHREGDDDLAIAFVHAVGWPAGPEKLRIMLVSLAVIAAIVLTLAAWHGYESAGRLGVGRVYVKPFHLIVETDNTRRFSARLDAVMRRSLVSAGVETGTLVDSSRSQAVGLLLNGSIDDDGGIYRVTVHIDDPAQHLTLWSMQFQRLNADATALRNQVASSVTGALRCGIAARRSQSAGMPVRVFSLFLHMCTEMELNSGQRADIARLHDLAKRAVALAPQLAVSQGMYAATSALMARTITGPKAARQPFVADARKAAVRALKRDPHNGAAYWALAAMMPDGPQSWPVQEAYLHKVGTTDMDFPLVASALVRLARQEGRLEEAERLQRRVAALDPYSPFQISALAWILATQDRHPEARTLLARAASVWPNAIAVRDYRFQAAVWHEPPAIAMRRLRENTAALGLGNVDVACFEAFLHARQHRDPAAVAKVRRVCRRVPHTNLLPRMLAYLGDTEGAYRTIGDADIDTYSTFFLFFPEMREFRRDKRFMAVAARLGLVEYWQTTDRWPDFCAEPDLPYDCRKQARVATDSESSK